MFPIARQDNLSVRELADEVLVYDQHNNKAHCLNKPAALIWKHCDGTTSITELTAMLRRETGVQADEALVRLALAQLSRRGLLQGHVPDEDAPARWSRRDVLKQMAAAMIAVPVVMTLTAPRASAAESLSGSCRGVCTVGTADCDNFNPVGRCFCDNGVCNPRS